MRRIKREKERERTEIFHRLRRIDILDEGKIHTEKQCDVEGW